MRSWIVLLLTAAVLLAGCGSSSSTTTGPKPAAPKPAASVPRQAKPKVPLPKGPAPKKLVVRDLRPGTGPAAKPGDTLTVDYVGVLYKGGKEFDASFGKPAPFPFVLQANAVIPGWDQGLEGMKAGGRRELIIPPALAYKAAGHPPTIPPNSPLVFVIDLLKVR